MVHARQLRLPEVAKAGEHFFAGRTADRAAWNSSSRTSSGFRGRRASRAVPGQRLGRQFGAGADTRSKPHHCEPRAVRNDYECIEALPQATTIGDRSPLHDRPGGLARRRRNGAPASPFSNIYAVVISPRCASRAGVRLQDQAGGGDLWSTRSSFVAQGDRRRPSHHPTASDHATRPTTRDSRVEVDPAPAQPALLGGLTPCTNRRRHRRPHFAGYQATTRRSHSRLVARSRSRPAAASCTQYCWTDEI